MISRLRSQKTLSLLGWNVTTGVDNRGSISERDREAGSYRAVRGKSAIVLSLRLLQKGLTTQSRYD